MGGAEPCQPKRGVEKKGSDRGIDGLLTFTDKNNELETVVVSVKSGHVNSGMVRDLKGTLEREKAAIGLFVTLEEPTKEMLLEASTAGTHHSDLWNRDYQRIQILRACIRLAVLRVVPHRLGTDGRARLACAHGPFVSRRSWGIQDEGVNRAHGSAARWVQRRASRQSRARRDLVSG